MPLEIIKQDITTMKVDAIVNAANTALKGEGTGVDGSIHRAAGPMLQKECDTLGGCPVGFAKITKAYELPCKYVIHTVGPVWQGGCRGEYEALASCYRFALELAREYRCESVAFPIISSGAYGFPRAAALEVARQSISAFLARHEMQVCLVVYNRGMVELREDVRGGVENYLRRNFDRDDRTCMASRADPCYNAPQSRNWEAEEAEMRPCAAPAPAPAEKRKSRLFALFSPEKGFGRLEETFSQTVLKLIDEKGMTEPECYHRANISRAVFSSLRTNVNYKPSKQTALALAVALELDLDQTRKLLEKAGLALSHSQKGDVIVEYFILQGCYDVFSINEVLFAYDQALLGNMSRGN